MTAHRVRLIYKYLGGIYAVRQEFESYELELSARDV